MVDTKEFSKNGLDPISVFVRTTFRKSLIPKGLLACIMVLGCVLGMLTFSSVPVCRADSDMLQIAVIGPMSGKDHEGGQAMLDGVNLYVDRVNHPKDGQGRDVMLDAPSEVDESLIKELNIKIIDKN